MESIKNDSNPEEILESFLTVIETRKCHVTALREASRLYDTKYLNVDNLTPLRVRRIFPVLSSKFEGCTAKEESWAENERRFFVWILICYMYVTEKKVADLNSNDFDLFAKLLPTKQEYMFRFQAQCLLKQPQKRWNVEEDQLLLKLIQLQLGDQPVAGVNLDGHWNHISKQFFVQSEFRLFRSPKQCRERWQNQLDPAKLKGSWTPAQDLLLFRLVWEHGKKWSKFVTEFHSTKNQHMIKNRFNSLVRKFSKEHEDITKESKVIKYILRQLESEQETDQPQPEAPRRDEIYIPTPIPPPTPLPESVSMPLAGFDNEFVKGSNGMDLYHVDTGCSFSPFSNFTPTQTWYSGFPIGNIANNFAICLSQTFNQFIQEAEPQVE